MRLHPSFSTYLPTVATLLLAWLVASSPLLPAQSLPPLSGISVSLSTSTTRVLASPQAIRSQTLAAQITLRNRSGSPITYDFPDLATAQTKFQFTLYDQTDLAVWTGAARLPARPFAPTATTQTLRSRSAWIASAFIPLAPSGIWLPSGTYRIEAVLAGTPAVFAAASLEIVDPPPIVINPRPQSTLVSGLDQLSASLITDPTGTQKIRVSASGWVPHPGYTDARLIPSLLIAKPDGPGMPFFLDFTVTPPPPDAIYIMVIAQVTATIDIPFNGQSSVSVRAASGSQSVLVGDAPPTIVSRFPAHWGPVPEIQTMDFGELPGDYGMGSSTLANWIRRNMDADAANSAR